MGSEFMFGKQLNYFQQSLQTAAGLCCALGHTLGIWNNQCYRGENHCNKCGRMVYVQIITDEDHIAGPATTQKCDGGKNG